MARNLERVDKFLAELPGALRRQWREICERGIFLGIVGKVMRKLFRRGGARKPTGGTAEDAADWDLVDFHSNRGGCDEEAIADTLRDAGLSVDLRRYDSKRLRVLRGWMRRSGCLMLILQLVVAVTTALATLYFDKSFGTAVDYLKAFTWGLGTVAVLEGVWTALNRLTTPVE